MSVLTENKNQSKIYLFIDYIPAELHQTKDWLIVFYCKNPVSNKLERQRIRVPKIKSSVERIRFAKKMVAEINQKLASGWSPFFEQTGKNLKSWKDAIVDFERNLQKQLKDGALRRDSIRTYTSNLNLIKEFISLQDVDMTFAIQFNKAFCVKYLDWIYLDRASAPRTRNNHLIFLRLLGNYFLSRGILAENPTTGIKNLNKLAKKRIYIPADIRENIKNEIILQKNGFHCLCMTIYYCMIRNTELAKLKVENVNLINNTIFVPKEISKNKKDETVTILDDFLPIIKNHIENAKPNSYLFSNDNFYTGTEPMATKKIYRKWLQLQTKLKFKKEYQFYSLKDTGITNLFLLGLPAIKIRDQARHSSIQITELYTPRNMKCDETIRMIENKF